MNYDISIQLTCSVGQYEDMRPIIRTNCETKKELESELKYLANLQKEMYKQISPKYKNLQKTKDRIDEEIEKMDKKYFKCNENKE